MSYIEFDKTKLINLEFMLERELVRANRGGAFACQTIVGCNTRRHHGLLITPQPEIDLEKHVLLSAIHETIIQHEAEFNFGINRYMNGQYFPKGHKYVRHFSTDPNPIILYRVGGVMLQKEIVFSSLRNQVLIRYTLLEAHSETKIRIKPFLAFRNINHLSKCNEYADKSYHEIKNGIKCKMYQGYSFLHLQFSTKPKYFHQPDWYYDLEYFKEIENGYDSHEDLFVPGYFELNMKTGESFVMSASLEELEPNNFADRFNKEVNLRIPRTNFVQNLKNSAQQFIHKSDEKCEIIAGYPWFDRIGRDTFISMPGMLLVNGEFGLARMVFDTMISEMNNGLFPNSGKGSKTDFNSADTSLWFIWALQQYVHYTGDDEEIWDEYGSIMKRILNDYRTGTQNGIKMTDKGLIFAYHHGIPLTWMSTVVNGNPVTPRYGHAVEINSLWYNAIGFAMELATKFKDTDFIELWEDIFEIIPKHFKETFWDKSKGYLCDCDFHGDKDWRVRPNMIFATSLPYSPISDKIQQLIIEKVKSELLTPRGLRTLTPTDIEYKGIYEGNAIEREFCYHQGTVFPWMICHFTEAYLRIYGRSGLSYVKQLFDNFEETIREHGIGTISELYDGDPPHKPGGAISYAMSVSELLRMGFIIQNFETQESTL